MGIWGMERGWVSRGSVEGDKGGSVGKNRGGSGSGSSVGCQGVGGCMGCSGDGSLGRRTHWTSVLGECALGICPGVSRVTGDQSWGKVKKRCC